MCSAKFSEIIVDLVVEAKGSKKALAELLSPETDFQGCTCHGVDVDETCLDCLRSKAYIGR